jgi:hypothetical protein
MIADVLYANSHVCLPTIRELLPLPFTPSFLNLRLAPNLPMLVHPQAPGTRAQLYILASPNRRVPSPRSNGRCSCARI